MTCSLSLKTSQRQAAVSAATHLLSTLRAFHLDNPDATWEQLKEHLLWLAEGVLQSRSYWEGLGSSGMGSIGHVYSDLEEDLSVIAATEPLNVDQTKALALGRRMMLAAEKKTAGDPSDLIAIIEELSGITNTATPMTSTTVSASIAHPVAGEAITFEKLYKLHMEERQADWQPATLRNKRACYGTLAGLLGELDLRIHTRKDMTDLKACLMEGRKPSTVNKILIELSSVMAWGEDNGYLNKTFGKGLQIRKGSESGREAFTPTQVAELMAYANKLPASSWQRWALSLGVITGARIGEIHQATTEDLTETEEQLVLNINANNGKTLKNKFSARVVPVASAYGVDATALLAFAKEANGKLFKMSSSGFTTQLNQLTRDVLGTETNTGQSFHSLRHHLAGAMKAAEVPLGIAQEILGHSSGSITFDLYGAGRAVRVQRMAEALRVTLPES